MAVVKVSFKIEPSCVLADTVQGKVHRQNHFIVPGKWEFADMYIDDAPKTDGILRVVLNATNAWDYRLRDLVKNSKTRMKPVMRIKESHALTFDLQLLGDAPSKSYTQHLTLRFSN